MKLTAGYSISASTRLIECGGLHCTTLEPACAWTVNGSENGTQI